MADKQINLRVTEEKHAAIKARAEQSGVSQNAWLDTAIDYVLAKGEGEQVIYTRTQTTEVTL